MDFTLLPNDILINILVMRKNIKRDERYKKERIKLISSIDKLGCDALNARYRPGKTDLENLAMFCPLVKDQSITSILWRRMEYMNRRWGMSRRTRHHRHEWCETRNSEERFYPASNLTYEFALVAKAPFDVRTTYSLIDDYRELIEDGEDMDDWTHNHILLFINKLYPEWGIKYLAQDDVNDNGWLPSDAGYCP